MGLITKAINTDFIDRNKKEGLKKKGKEVQNIEDLQKKWPNLFKKQKNKLSIPSNVQNPEETSLQPTTEASYTISLAIPIKTDSKDGKKETKEKIERKEELGKKEHKKYDFYKTDTKQKGKYDDDTTQKQKQENAEKEKVKKVMKKRTSYTSYDYIEKPKFYAKRASYEILQKMQKTQEKNKEESYSPDKTEKTEKSYIPSYTESSNYIDKSSLLTDKEKTSPQKIIKSSNHNKNKEISHLNSNQKKGVKVTPAKQEKKEQVKKEEPIKKFTYYKETKKGSIEYTSEFQPAKDVKEKSKHVQKSSLKNLGKQPLTTGEKEEKRAKKRVSFYYENKKGDNNKLYEPQPQKKEDTKVEDKNDKNKRLVIEQTKRKSSIKKSLINYLTSSIEEEEKYEIISKPSTVDKEKQKRELVNFEEEMGLKMASKMKAIQIAKQKRIAEVCVKYESKIAKLESKLEVKLNENQSTPLYISNSYFPFIEKFFETKINRVKQKKEQKIQKVRDELDGQIMVFQRKISEQIEEQRKKLGL